jgi:N utilization substance protein B
VVTSRMARHLALQALYEIDCAQHNPETVLRARLETQPLSKRNEEFMRCLVEGVLKHREALDSLIYKHAPEWPLDQMAVVDRNILRMAIYEFVIGQTTPVKVAIDEAVELASTFGSDSTPRFINGVLGTLAAKRAELTAAFGQSSE